MPNYVLNGPLYTGVNTPSAAPTNTTDFSMLQHRLDALEMACSGMWTLLKAKHGYTDEELVTAIHEVDSRDGKIDNRIAPAQAVCPHCGKKALSRQSTKCLWCGAPMGVSPF